MLRFIVGNLLKAETVIFTDSKVALSLIRSYSKSFRTLVLSIIACIKCIFENGTKLSLQWIPSHRGIRGNVVVDLLAKEAHNLN